MSAEPVNPLAVQMARLEGSCGQVNLRLSSLEGQTAEIRGNLRGLRDDIDARFDKLDRKLNGFRADIDKKIDARFNLIVLLGALLVVLQILSALDII